MRASLRLAVLLGLAACMSPGAYYESRTPAWVSERTKIEYDSFKKETAVLSPEIVRLPGRNGERIESRLRGWVIEGLGGFQVYATSVHKGRWHHYRVAFDEDGTELALNQIESRPDCSTRRCTFYETVGVVVPLEYLEQRRTRGIRMKLDGTGGDVIVEIPAGYVAGFLEAFERARAVDPRAAEVRRARRTVSR